MKNESGRSMIEVIGIMAIGAIMLVGAIKMYQTIRVRQIRINAVEYFKTISENAKLLFGGRGDYSGISIDYMIGAGAVKDGQSPISNTEYSVQSESEGKEFSINLTGVSFGDCSYFATVKMDWVKYVSVNGNTDNAKSSCADVGGNQVSFFVK